MRVAISVAIAALVVVLAATAWAGPAPAVAAFDRGQALKKQGKWAEAKVAFEESQRLEPKTGTRFNIAQCDEHLGKLASAIAVYRDLAANDTVADRKALATDLVKQLEARVPRLQIKLSPPVVEARLTLNGAAIAGSTVTVDFGEYTIGATAPGYEDGSATATVSEEGHTIVVTVPMVAKANAVTTKPPVAPAKPGMSGRKKGAIVLLGLGSALVVGGGIAGLSASSAWDEAKAICGGSTTCATEDDAARANELAADARGTGNLSTALVIGGAAVVTIGIVLWATAPKQERRVSVGAAPTSDGFAVAIGGRF